MFSAALALPGAEAARGQSGPFFNAVTNLNPVAYWPLDETTLPPPSALATNIGSLGSAGNAAYSSSGITYQEPGALTDGDTSIFTDGSSGIVTLPFSPVLSLNAPFSVEAWLLDGQPTIEQCPLACVTASSPRSGWLIYMDGVNPGAYNFRMYNQNGATVSLNISGPASSIVAGTWYHVVAVYDGTNGSLYVDGSLVASAAPSLHNGVGFVPNVSGALTIGGRSDAGFLYQGAEDEVAIYTNALSAATIAAHYAAGTNASPSPTYKALVLQSNPLLYYRLDEPTYTAPPETSDPVANNYGSSGADAIGYYLPGCFPGTVPGPQVAGFPSQVACHFEHAYGGYVDVIDGNSTLNLLGPVTLTAWIQGAPDNLGNFQSFAGRGDPSYRGDVDANGDVHFADGPNPDDTGAYVNDGNWHFIAGTWDGTNENVYIDGALSATQSATTAITGDPDHFVIGGDGQYAPGSRLFNGNISEVAVFGTNLTAAQVQSLYYAAEVLPFITQQPAGVTVAQASTAHLSVTANGTPALSYQWYKGSSPLAGADFSGTNTSTLTISPAALGDSGSYSVVITNNYGAVTSSVAVVTVTLAPFIVSQPTPTNLTMYVGNQVNYQVGVVGGQPLSFQWYSGASRISGATGSNYTFKVIAGTNNYTLVVTNSFGTVTSVVATVIGVVFVPPTSGFTLNFDAPPNGNASDVYAGPGAYSDNPANTFTNWNPIGGSGVINGPALTSASNQTLVTTILDYGFNNTGQAGAAPGTPPNGTPTYLVGTEDAVNGGSPGIGTPSNPEGQFIINGLPQGSYVLYVYAENYDGNRGSVIFLNPTNGGVADAGISATTNGIVNGNGAPHTSAPLVEGDNYVFFHHVLADPTGTISGTYIPNPNPDPSFGLTGEAPFNGLQLALNELSIVRGPTPGNVTVTWSGGALYSAPSLNGPWNPVAGTSPLVISATGAAQFFLVW